MRLRTRRLMPLSSGDEVLALKHETKLAFNLGPPLQLNALSVSASPVGDERRNYVIVVGRRQASVTDSEKLESNPENPDPEFVVASAVDASSILDPSAFNFTGGIQE